MIRLQLNRDAMLSMFFDEIEGGKSSFSSQEGAMIASISKDEFDGFLKANNLITYRNTLKAYEDGSVYGEFEIQ